MCELGQEVEVLSKGKGRTETELEEARLIVAHLFQVWRIVCKEIV